MKIAVCLYGQPRTWIKCIEWIKQCYAKHDVDYFCNLKNYNTEKFSGTVTRITEAESKQLIREYNPKKHFVELKDTFNGLGGFSSTMLSIVNSVNLKQQYELENDFQYDLCILQRYDCLTGPNRDWLHRFISDVQPKVQTLYVTKNNILFGQDCYKMGITDLLMMGHNTAIDSLAGNLINNFNPGRDMDKVIDSHLYTPHIMLRDACLHNNIAIEQYEIDSLLIREDSNLYGGIEENWWDLSDHWKP